MTKLLSLILAGLLATPVHADGFDFIGTNSTAEKPAKAPREKHPASYVMHSVGDSATGMVLGATMGYAGILVTPFTANYSAKLWANKVNDFYFGSVVRGRVKEVVEIKKNGWGLTPDLVSHSIVGLLIKVDGPLGSDRVVLATAQGGYQVGDIVDAKIVSAEPAEADFDFNKHKPRVVSLYCKHDNAACQDDYESSLGVLYRHTDTEFPPSQYLIAPAIIAADQAKMKKEAEDKKAAQQSGGFSFM